jgi:3-phenylpropionate/cinnamic acid dioxygenase small subunit
MDHGLYHEVQEFLIHEARLLDGRLFDEWLNLFTEDAVYWMPERLNQWESNDLADWISKPGDLSLFEETKETLRTRVARLATGMAWSEVPPSRTRHLITNVEVEAGATEPEVKVRSNFLVYKAQLEHSLDIFVGMRDDVLRQVSGQ